MFNRRILLALAAGTSFLALTASGFAQSPIKVVASFSILGDIVANIGGDNIELTTLVGPNGDAHVYEPSAADARTVAAADVVIVNGLEFEGWLARLIEASEFKGEPVVASAGIVPLSFAEEGEHTEHDEEAEHADSDGHEDHGHGASDPHAWQDLANGIAYTKTIAAALETADPAHADEYAANAAAYIDQLTALDAEIKAEIATLPADQRRVVTSHDAFGYFSNAYGIEFLAPEGVSTEAEASAADVASIIEQIRAENIKAVFVENITDPRLIEQISSETGVKVGGELYSDALSDADGSAPTYVGMFQYNADQIVSTLAGK